MEVRGRQLGSRVARLRCEAIAFVGCTALAAVRLRVSEIAIIDTGRGRRRLSSFASSSNRYADQGTYLNNKSASSCPLYVAFRTHVGHRATSGMGHERTCGWGHYTDSGRRSAFRVGSLSLITQRRKNTLASLKFAIAVRAYLVVPAYSVRPSRDIFGDGVNIAARLEGILTNVSNR